MNKPRLVEVTAPIERVDLLAARSRGDLSCPLLVDMNPDGRIWADADELRAWRASQPETEAAK